MTFQLAVLTIISDAKHLKGSFSASSDCSGNCAVSKGHFKLLKQLRYKKWVTMNTEIPKYKMPSSINISKLILHEKQHKHQWLVKLVM